MAEKFELLTPGPLFFHTPLNWTLSTLRGNQMPITTRGNEGSKKAFLLLRRQLIETYCQWLKALLPCA